MARRVHRKDGWVRRERPWWLTRYVLYRPWMRVLHWFHFCHMHLSRPDGDRIWSCNWCGASRVESTGIPWNLEQTLADKVAETQ